MASRIDHPVLERRADAARRRLYIGLDAKSETLRDHHPIPRSNHPDPHGAWAGQAYNWTSGRLMTRSLLRWRGSPSERFDILVG